MPVGRGYRRTRPFRRTPARRSTRFAIRGRDRGFLRTGGYYKRFNNRLPIVEKKFFEARTTTSPIPITMTKNNLNIIAQGFDEIQRIGRRILITKVMIRGLVQLAAAVDTESFAGIRMWIIQDLQTNGTEFTTTDFLELQLPGSSEYLSFNKLANKNRFKVLYDKTMVLNTMAQGSSVSFSTLEIPFNIFLDRSKKPIEIEYSDLTTTGSVSSQRSNSIWFCYVASASSDVGLTFHSRVRFTD